MLDVAFQFCEMNACLRGIGTASAFSSAQSMRSRWTKTDGRIWSGIQ
ncbi:hypothetical protein RRSWK_00015 [Rhodopirellula sp. SWK7]|nr:hypothetical protein RRSWK_00015 [Rhodopirellula sp. SWK7]